MMNLNRFSNLLFFTLMNFVVGCGVGIAQETKPTKEEQPGFDDFRALKVLEGKWKSTIRFWTGESGGAAQETKGEASFELTLGNKFIVEKSKGKIAENDYEGVGYWGYDQKKGKFTRVWMDSMWSGTVLSEGTINRERNTIAYYGKVNVPDGSKFTDKLMRWELDVSDKDKIILKMFDLSLNKDAKVMEIVYDRIKDEE